MVRRASGLPRPFRHAIRAAIALAAFGALAALAGCGPTPASSDGCKLQLLPGDLVITEVFADYQANAQTGGTGADTGKEWFEIYNARGQSIDLAGLTITHSRPDGSQPSTHVVGQATIAPGQFFTLGNAAPGAAPAYVDYAYGKDLGDLSNTAGGKLTLSCGGSEIDSAIYGDVKPGHSRELTGAQPPDYTLNDDQASWCQANDTEFEAGNFGTPGADNDCRPIVTGQCSDAGTMRAAVAPGPGDLVITEVMPSPSIPDDVGEWFEARVMNDVDLAGVGIGRVGSTAPDVIPGTDCVHVRAGSDVVFARSADPTMNGGIPAASIVGTFKKFNLVSGSATSPGDVAIVAGRTVVDAVTWTRSTSGAALQLDPARIDPTANDDESNFCDATQPYGSGDLGTPGAANTRCAALPKPGMCDDGGTLRKIVPPAPGQLVISEILANPANVSGTTDATREWFEVASTATAFDLNELVVGRAGATGTAVQSARCLSVPARGFAVFARSADPALNGMLPSVAATFKFGLVDTSGDIQIARADGTVLDAVRWASVTSGVASQLDPSHISATDNDITGNFCPATTPYGDQTNQGTPGAANRPCP